MIEGEASNGEFLCVKSRSVFQLSKTWPSKVESFPPVYSYASLEIFFYPCVKNGEIMWIYMHFAYLSSAVMWYNYIILVIRE